VIVSVGAHVGITVEIDGNVIYVGGTDTVTTVNQVGIGVVHCVAGTVIMFDDGMKTVLMNDGTTLGLATTTKLVIPEIVAMLDNAKFSIAHVAVTTTGDVHVLGTEMLTKTPLVTNDDAGTVMT